MRSSLVIAAIAVCAARSSAAPIDHPAYLDEFQASERAHRPFRPITAFDAAVSLEEAYVIQHELIDRNLAADRRIAGYRGGLMSEASLRQRAVREPLVGVQFLSSRRRSPAAISLDSYRHPAIEVKIGFVFGQALPPGRISIGQLRRAVKAVVPVIDLPDIGYSDPSHYSAVDMVAANISAAEYVEGHRSRRCTDLNAERVTLVHDGIPINQGKGADSLGDIWESLRVVVRLAQEQGYRIRRGDLVLTGKLGGKVDVNVGHYEARFSCLGSVSVQLIERSAHLGRR